MERFNLLKNSSASGNDIHHAFATLSLDGKSLQPAETTVTVPKNDQIPQVWQPAHMSNELPIILMAMRKIREAIVASSRMDAFASEVYKFIIRTTILLKHMESYHPALLHLIHKINPVIPLSSVEYHEFLGYYILDLACREEDLAAAYQVKCSFGYRDAKIEAVLQNLIHGNWCRFWVLREGVTTHERSLMEWAEGRIRTQAFRCLGKSYLRVDKKYLEQSLQHPWETIKEKYAQDWQLEGDSIIFRGTSRK